MLFVDNGSKLTTTTDGNGNRPASLTNCHLQPMKFGKEAMYY
jgi:hypothetical protein